MQRAPFTAIAQVYDAIMQDVPYDDWVAFALREATARGWRGGRVLDVGCGTGNATVPLVERGFEVVGLDASADMLAAARTKLPDVPFVLGDVRDAPLPGTFSLAVSVFDALNNLLGDGDLERAATHLRASLDPGGVLAFDVNTTRGLEALWETDVAEGWAGEVHYRWVHRWDAAVRRAVVDAWCASPHGTFVERHEERPYDPDELRSVLTAAGYARVDVVAYPDGRPASAAVPRVWVFAVAPGRAPVRTRGRTPA
ncbi:MAG: class I SAM-dependent methyltransferase [Trueperaceae bacterium]|nr:class I SAM-dependent methyltransferase [Trueperaceae bacterium]